MKGPGALWPRVLLHLLVVRPFVRLALGLSVTGGENLRAADRFILVANHNSHLDVLLLLSALPVRALVRTRPVAAADHFSKRRLVFRVAEWLVDPVWIDRKGPARRSLGGMEEWLASGGSLVLFPEGTRGTPGRLERFREGLGQIAGRFPEIPVIPAWLSGTERSLPRRAVLPVPVWNTLTVGPPQVYRGDRREITAAIRSQIEELGRTAPGAARKPDRLPARTVAVLGIDGSGKSTLSRSLARRLSSGGRSCHVSDRLEVYQDGEPGRFQPLPSERLRRVLSARAKRAGSLGSYKLPKLAELLLRDHLLKQARTWYRPGFVILDGSPLMNLAAWAGLYRDEPLTVEDCAAAVRILTTGGAEASGDPLFRRFPELAALAGLGLANFDLPDAVILLDADPAVALERIRSRGEPLQAHERPESLRRLRGGYLTVAGAIREKLGLSCLTIPGDGDPAEILSRALDFTRALGPGCAPETPGGLDPPAAPRTARENRGGQARGRSGGRARGREPSS